MNIKQLKTAAWQDILIQYILELNTHVGFVESSLLKKVMLVNTRSQSIWELNMHVGCVVIKQLKKVALLHILNPFIWVESLNALNVIMR